jgi:hypothetical protein
MDTFSEQFERLGTHLKNAQGCYTEADKRFDKASNTLDSLLATGDTSLPVSDDPQGTLALPSPPAAAKKGA